MSSPVLNSADFGLVADKFHAVDADQHLLEQIESDGEALLTGRAIAFVTLFCAGFWYVLWKVSLHFWMTR